MVNSGSACIYKGCKNNKKNNPTLTFHRIPIKMVDITSQWIQNIGNTDLVGLSPKKIHVRRICSEHFEEKHFARDGRRVRLLENAVPKDCRLQRTGHVVDSHVAHHENEAVFENFVPQTTISKKKNARQIIRQLRATLLKSHDLVSRFRRENFVLRRTILRLKRRQIHVDADILKENLASVIENKKNLQFLLMQVNHCKQRKWTDEEKRIALSIYLHGPNCYKFLRNELEIALPCISLIQQ